VELYEAIRREYEFGIGTIQGVARKFGVHRRMVREALAHAIPLVKASPQRPHPQLEPVRGFIDAILEAVCGELCQFERVEKRVILLLD